jgi:hypothetical protein
VRADAGGDAPRFVASSDRTVRHDDPVWARQGWIVVWVIAGAVLSVLTAPLAVGLARDRLHVRCEADPLGGDSFICADGIGYLESLAVLLCAAVVPAFLSGLLIFVNPSRTTRTRLLVVVAIAGIAWAFLATWFLVHRSHGLADTAAYWSAALLPAALILAAASATALGSVFGSGRIRVIGLRTAAVLVLAATLVQPGLAVCTLTAAGILAAAAAGASATQGAPSRSDRADP